MKKQESCPLRHRWSDSSLWGSKRRSAAFTRYEHAKINYPLYCPYKTHYALRTTQYEFHNFILYWENNPFTSVNWAMNNLHNCVAYILCAYRPISDVLGYVLLCVIKTSEHIIIYEI